MLRNTITDTFAPTLLDFFFVCDRILNKVHLIVQKDIFYKIKQVLRYFFKEFLLKNVFFIFTKGILHIRN